MKELKKENRLDYINEYNRSVEYTGVSFDQYGQEDDFTYSIKQMFYRDNGLPYDFVDRQDLQFSNTTYLFFQIPLADRKYDLMRGSIEINVGTHTIQDDENGNLYEVDDLDETVLIGNIFYESGCIFITSEGNFFSNPTNIQTYFGGNTATIKFKKYVQLRERNLIVEISEKEWNSTSNPTWDGQPIHFNKIFLYNDDYDVVATAQISRNIPLKNTITVLLESIEIY